MSDPVQNMTSLANALNTAVPQKVMSGNGVMNRDLLKWLPKDGTLTGDGKFVTVQTAVNRGSGSSYAQSKVNISAAALDRFDIRSSDFYLQDTVERKLMMSTKGMGGVLDAKVLSIKDMGDGVGFDIEKACWGNGSGSMGSIGSITSATNSVITLAIASDVNKFSRGDAITAYNGATARTDTISRIIAINRSAGTVTITGDKVTAGTWTAGDDLYFGSFGTTGGVGADSKTTSQLNGLGIWIPAVAETSGTFLGVDRTTDVERLQGHRVAFDTNQETTWGNLYNQISQVGGRPTDGWCSFSSWNNLKNELGTKLVLDPGVGRFGLEGIMYGTPHGKKPIMQGAMCPDASIYFLKRDTWNVHHTGGLPHFMPSINSESFDGMVLGVSAFAELSCSSPFDNGTAPTS